MWAGSAVLRRRGNRPGRGPSSEFRVVGGRIRRPWDRDRDMRVQGKRLATFKMLATVLLSCDVAACFVNVVGNVVGICGLSKRGEHGVPVGHCRLGLAVGVSKARAQRSFPGALGAMRMSDKGTTKGRGSVLDGAVSFFANAVGIDFMTAEERAAKEVEEGATAGGMSAEEEEEQGQDLEAARRKLEYEGKVAGLGQNFREIKEMLSTTAEEGGGIDDREEQFRQCLERSKFLIQSLCMWVPEDGTSRAATGNVSLPDAHCMALDFIGVLQADAKKRDPKLASCFKWLPKKLGLSPLISIVGKGGSPSYRTPREMRLACRDVERGVSEAVHLVATHAYLRGSNSQGDYVDSCRSGLEHINVRDRHAAVMLLSAYFRLLTSATSARQPVWGDFKKRFPSDFGHSTASARAAYPLLEIPVRRWTEATGLGSVDTVKLVERLTRADPLGDTCEGMQRWAVSEGLLSRVDRSAARAARQSDTGETVAEGGAPESRIRSGALKHQLMRELTGAAPALVQGVDTDQWKQVCGSTIYFFESLVSNEPTRMNGGRWRLSPASCILVPLLVHVLHCTIITCPASPAPASAGEAGLTTLNSLNDPRPLNRAREAGLITLNLATLNP